MSLDPKRTQVILEAAGDVFCQEGYMRASMDRVARAAGVSKATLYNHFADKSALFRAAVRRVSETFVLELDGLGLDRLDLSTALERLGCHFLEFLLTERNLSVVRAVLAESQHDPQLGRAFHESGPAIAQQAVAHLLARRMVCGDLPTVDSLRAARHYVALLRGDLFWRALLRVPVAPEELPPHVKSIVSHFLSGLGAI